MATVTRPPGPDRDDLRERLPMLAQDTLEFHRRLAADFGDAVYFKVGVQATYFFNDPEAIRQVLVTKSKAFTKGQLNEIPEVLGHGLLTSEGDLHRRMRKAVTPVLHPTRIPSYVPAMARVAAELRDSWNDGQSVDILRDMCRTTLTVICESLWGDRVGDADADAIHDALTAVQAVFNRRASFGVSRQAPDYREGASALQDYVERVLAAPHAPDGDGLISLLRAHRDADGNPVIDEDQIRDEVMTLLLAGHESTGNTLTWAWTLLASHPEQEARLHEEVDRVLGDRLATAEDVRELHFAEWVMAETLRLYPPISITQRRAATEVEIAGWHVPADAMVVLSPFVTQRDERFFPDPERFLPERWKRDDEGDRPRYAYYPFMAGPRGCLGEAFAWEEGTTTLATIAQRWALRVHPDDDVSAQPLLTLRPRTRIRMTVKKRGGLGG